MGYLRSVVRPLSVPYGPGEHVLLARSDPASLPKGCVIVDAWAHLHLPRLKSGDTKNVISLKTPGKKIEYVSSVELSNPTFKVSEKGRQRALRDNVRNVHAWVVGELRAKSYNVGALTLPWRRAIYDPWKGETFVDSETLQPVLSAERALLTGKFVYYQ